MFLLKFLRFFTGFVRFRASGGFGERFLNLCSQNGIILWDVEADNNVIYATTSIDGYKKIRPAARNSGMTARIVKKTGIPFLIFRYRKRIGIPVGILLFVICLSFLSTRIWLIDVDGNKTIPSEYIISAAEDAGLRVGCSRFSADPVKISLAVCTAAEGTSDVKINISGSRATIKIKEREPEPDIINLSGMYDLTASKDAQLVVLEPYRGTAIAKIFNTVLKGEILISGIVGNKDESTGYVHASGYAVGRTETGVKSSVEKNENFSRIKKAKSRKIIFFFGAEIPLGKTEKNYDFAFKKEKFLSFSGKRMPVGILCDKYSFVSEESIKLNENQKKLICIERYVQSAKSYTDTRQLISEKVSENFSGENKSVSGIFACYENIGVEKEFSINEGSLSD